MPSQEEVPSVEAESLLAHSDDRVNALEGTVWTIPGLSVTGQALLLSIALNPASSNWGRLLTAALAFVVALATCLLLARTLDYYKLHRRVAANARKNLKLPAVDAKDLRRFAPGELKYPLQRRFAGWSSVRDRRRGDLCGVRHGADTSSVVRTRAESRTRSAPPGRRPTA